MTAALPYMPFCPKPIQEFVLTNGRIYYKFVRTDIQLRVRAGVPRIRRKPRFKLVSKC